MEKEHLIPARLFCTHHEVEISFINSLEDIGLLHVTRIENEDFIEETELEKLERLARLHQELDVNLEGIDVINYLLERISTMQDEMNMLRQKLSFYETGFREESDR